MRTIELHGKHANGKKAYIDDEDYEKLSKYKWFVTVAGYPARGEWNGGNYKIIYMHREVMGNPKGMVIDHIDRNKRNNEKENLRIVPQTQNLLNAKLREDNKYGMKNVYYVPRTKRYQVKLRYLNKNYTGGTYSTLAEAGIALDKLKLKVYGLDLYVELHR